MSDIDERDHRFLTGERTAEGYHVVRGGLEAATARALAYAPYADILWCETPEPDLDDAARFAEAIHAEFPGKLLAYNCSPSFNWRQHLSNAEIARFQDELAALGYRFQFITLAGWHVVNYQTFDLARALRRRRHGRLQQVAEPGVRLGGPRLHRHQAPGRGGSGLLRPGHGSGDRWPGFDAGSGGVNRTDAVQLRLGPRRSGRPRRARFDSSLRGL